jgi:hypothetical protein
MNFGIFFIVLMMILSVGSGLVAGEASAMGPNVNAVRPEEQKLNGKQDEKNRGNGIKGEGSSPEKKNEVNPEGPSPKKEPRIKYRDMFECSC